MLDIGLHSVSTIHCQCQPSDCCICFGLVHIFTPHIYSLTSSPDSLALVLSGARISHYNHSISHIGMVQHTFWKVKMRIRLEFGNNIVWICTQIWDNPLRIYTKFTPKLKRIRSRFVASFGHFHLVTSGRILSKHLGIR